MRCAEDAERPRSHKEGETAAVPNCPKGAGLYINHWAPGGGTAVRGGNSTELCDPIRISAAKGLRYKVKRISSLKAAGRLWAALY
jgi:hypothetical protein